MESYDSERRFLCDFEYCQKESTGSTVLSVQRFCLNVRCFDHPYFNPVQRVQTSTKVWAHNQCEDLRILYCGDNRCGVTPAWTKVVLNPKKAETPIGNQCALYHVSRRREAWYHFSAIWCAMMGKLCLYSHSDPWFAHFLYTIKDERIFPICWDRKCVNQCCDSEFWARKVANAY